MSEKTLKEQFMEKVRQDCALLQNPEDGLTAHYLLTMAKMAIEDSKPELTDVTSEKLDGIENKIVERTPFEEDAVYVPIARTRLNNILNVLKVL